MINTLDLVLNVNIANAIERCVNGSGVSCLFWTCIRN